MSSSRIEKMNTGNKILISKEKIIILKYEKEINFLLNKYKIESEIVPIKPVLQLTINVNTTVKIK
jgi:hypothetical protein